VKRFFHDLFVPTLNKREGEAPSERKLAIATAALLLEIAETDNNFSDEERSLIVSLLRQRFGLSGEEVNDLIEATREELNRRIDTYYFTNLINEQFDKPQKIEIIEMVWRVIYTDNHLDGHEDRLVHSFARLLRLDHSEMIAAKLKIKNQLRTTSS